MPLSQSAMDDSGPPVVHYGMHAPAATSTPTHTEVNTHSLQQEDSYQQIIPGIPQGSLYPILASLSSEERHLPEETQTLHNKLHCLHWLKALESPGLYSHIAHSNDKDEMEIPQPFKGAHPKQPKPRGRGKGK